MPFYNYYCKPCEEVFSDLVSGENYQDPQECPSCGKLSERTARGQEINAHGVGLKEHSRASSSSSRRKVEESWLEGEIDNTKEAIEGKSGVSPYTNYKINHNVAVEQGLAKKVDPKTARVRRKSSKDLTQTVAKAMSDKDRKRSEDGHNIKDN
jgi:putative FmdB family regulatory protein